MEEKELLIEQEGNVRVVTLNRPEAMNALSFGMVKGLAAAFRDAGEDDSVRAMILTANGRGFCTGADLTGPGGRQDISTPVGMKLTTGLYGEMVNALANLVNRKTDTDGVAFIVKFYFSQRRVCGISPQRFAHRRVFGGFGFGNRVDDG